MEFPEKITSIEDALSIIRKIREDVIIGSENPFYNHNTLNIKSLFTDIWFRGEEAIFEKPLTPKLFRKNYDETTIYNYLPTYVHELREMDNDFDRLCYMQHYGVPTRLLDWTDNILVALYFAVQSNPEKDGKLYVLNSRLLNKYTGLKKGNKNILNKDNLGTVLRCIMIHSDSCLEWEDKMKRIVKFNWGRNDLNDIPIKEIFKTSTDYISTTVTEQVKVFCTPCSVRPDKSNSRILHQGGLFTIHGGKNKTTTDELDKNMEISAPIDLLTINKIGNFILDFEIPCEYKKSIKEDLLYLQIHEGKMFPELEKQVEFIDLIGLKY